MPTGLGDEQIWISATNDNTGTSTAFDDQSAEGNDGTAVGGVLVVADTASGGTYAFDFDGVNDLIDCGNILTSLPNGYSLSCWVNADNADAYQHFIQKSYFDNKEPFVLKVRSTEFDLSVETTSGSGQNYLTQTPSPLVDGQWAHVCGTFDGYDFNLYVNGILIATQNYPAGVTVNDSGYPVSIGAGKSGNSPTGFMAGKMDDVRMYSRAVSGAEVVHLATSRGVEGSPVQGIGGEKLWLCPTISNGVGDLSGNNNSTSLGSANIVTDGSDKHYDNTVTTLASSSINDLGPMTWACWVRTSLNSASTTDTFMSKFTAKTLSIRQGGSGNQRFEMVIDGSGGDVVTDSSYIPDPAYRNTWTHVAVTWNGTNSDPAGSLYIDGVYAYKIYAFAGTPKTDAAYDLTMGNSTNDVDDIRLYGRELTQDEVTYLSSSRGVLGGPIGPTTGFYNPFINKIFNNDYTRRIR
jgi:hypothetical protein